LVKKRLWESYDLDMFILG